MILETTRRAWPMLAALLLLFVAHPARADRQNLPDTTWVDRWELPCGLRVVARHIPRASTTSVTTTYRYGSRTDPDGREGLAEMVAEMVFSARAGDVAERRLQDLDRLRPSGWSLRVTPRITQLTESAPTGQFAGLFHQVCQRIRGVSPSDAGFKLCKSTARNRLYDYYDASPDRALYALAGELSAGRTAESTTRYGTGDGLDRISLQDVRREISERIKPGNAALCVVGNLDGVDLRKLVDQELGDLPAATAAPPIAWGGLKGANAVLERKDIDHPIGVLGIVAPALTDSLHPYFTAITFNAWLILTQAWGKPAAPLTARFQYSVASDPEMVRMYPPLQGGSLDLESALLESLAEAGSTIVDSVTMKRACEAGLWLIGGPLPFEVRQSAVKNPATVHTIATTLAALESYGNHAFWEEYRARFMLSPQLDLRPVLSFYVNRVNQVRVTFRVPEKKP